MHKANVLSSEDKSRIEGFLYREAQLLDDADLASWMELYSDDGVYWMPASPEQICTLTEISILYEDKMLMDIRRRNFGHTLSPSMEYSVRGSRVIGNVHLSEEQPGGGCLRVCSTFQAQLYYRDEMTPFAGRYTHDLIAIEDAYLIVRKRVDLINADGIHRNLLIYI